MAGPVVHHNPSPGDNIARTDQVGNKLTGIVELHYPSMHWHCSTE